MKKYLIILYNRDTKEISNEYIDENEYSRIVIEENHTYWGLLILNIIELKENEWLC